MLRKKAFTLSELLIALAIVGAISALAIPSIVEDMNRRMLANQLKNLSLTIQNLAGEQLINNKTQTLDNTDFKSPTALLSSSNFAIADDCSDRSKCVANSYGAIKNEGYSRAFPNYTTRKLKNGVTIAYTLSDIALVGAEDDRGYGLFYVDLNGIDKPNIIGRDHFVFRISKKGRMVDGTGNNNTSDATLKSYCKDGRNTPTACYTLVERNNWKINF
jgi:prepilin-type N-terminal cleavage/methylation domain-containing protein